jgi:hypothetical protein
MSNRTARREIPMLKIGMEYKELLGHTVRLVVDEWSGSGGTIHVSPECRNIGEVEVYAERLKNNIDDVVRQARRQFAEPTPSLPNRD